MLAFLSPSSPVHALAQPELTTRFDTGFKIEILETVTGAAQNAFVVNTPEATHGSDECTMQRSFTPDFLTLVAMAPTLNPDGYTPFSGIYLSFFSGMVEYRRLAILILTKIFLTTG